jgi:peptidoglycan/xylan/chitin deacetylase (PgdA/CDA1 family)
VICLTGDLHHMSLGTGNQKHCDITEVQVAQRYLALLRGAGVKVTFFVTGRAFAEEWSDLAPICADPLVEIGGHTYTCFEPSLLHRVSKKVVGSYNGPAAYERRDVRRTIDVIRRRTGRTIRLWRNHMYMHGPWTDRVLAEEGIQLCSDTVRAAATGPSRRPDGIIDLPINVIPDHEHLYHAERTREWVAAWRARYRWTDDFGPESYAIEEWTELAIEGLRQNEQRGALSTLIIHPITMYLCDRFAGFRRILEFIAARRTVHAGEVLGRALTERTV